MQPNSNKTAIVKGEGRSKKSGVALEKIGLRDMLGRTKGLMGKTKIWRTVSSRIHLGMC